MTASALTVWMNDNRVGRVDCDRDGVLTFTYDSEWVHAPNAMPISLQMPLSINTYRGEVPEKFFENLLPDNPKHRERIRENLRLPAADLLALVSALGGKQPARLRLSEREVRRISPRSSL